jgi:hypothetical protein
MHSITLTAASLLSIVAALPTTLNSRWPNATNILKPTIISQYSGTNGAITYNVEKGIAAKTNTGDITTLVTFDNTSRDDMPTTCRLRFSLDSNDNSIALEGTKQVNIFSSLKPAPKEGSRGWGGPGNQRNLDIDMVTMYRGGDFLVGYVPCPGKGKGPVGYEIVPVGDVDRVEWNGEMGGLYLTWD